MSAFDVYSTAKNFLIRQRRTIIAAGFLLQAVAANYIAFLLRFEFLISEKYLNEFLINLPVLLVIRLIFFLQAGLYKDMWRYASIGDMIRIIRSVSLASIAFMVVVRYLLGDDNYPRSIFILDWLLMVMMAGGSRLAIRVFRDYVNVQSEGRRVLIVGAGDAGEIVVRDMRSNPDRGYSPIGFIDDDPRKKGLTIHGVPIFGGRSVIPEVIEKHEPAEIVIAIPSASHRIASEVYELSRPYKLPIKVLPVLSEILGSEISVAQLRPLALEDLLRRDPIRTGIENVREFLEGRCVMVTGAGGSIGAELSRQIASYAPSRLVLLDRYENSLFELDLELSLTTPKGMLRTVVCDILDTTSLGKAFAEHRPQVVFHAAAHKHVPLMELNPLEAVKNNILGTRNVISASSTSGTESFVMISTDKAVNPTSVMGATKRVAEFLTVCGGKPKGARFNAVRFGNVLGSNASIVTIFQRQLSRGGPLTVTHPDMERFFMLVSEAVELVLIAAASGREGEIFVLDMGEPVKIMDLAENLITLSGLKPNEDVKIIFTGIRPGEKLTEELFDESEEMGQTFHEKLRIAVPHNVPTCSELRDYVGEMESIVGQDNAEEAVKALKRIIPGFKRGAVE